MVDRRALIIGGWKASGRTVPSAQKVRSIFGRWNKIFDDDLYVFRSLDNQLNRPKPLEHPSRADIVNLLDNASDVSSDTELLVYFLGHSVSEGPDNIQLIIDVDKEGNNRTIQLSWLISTITQGPIRNIVVILDTCHAGRTEEQFRIRSDNNKWFAMFGTGDAYAFDAAFSDALLRAFEVPIRKNDQRIDRRREGMTYRKIFEDALGRMISTTGQSSTGQVPRCYGEYGDTVLLAAPRQVPAGYNAFASVRSIYGRVFRLLEIIQQKQHTYDTLSAAVKSDRVFLLQAKTKEDAKYVSTGRLGEYLEFLRKAGFLIQPSGFYSLTDVGKLACSKDEFNEHVMRAIEDRILPDGVSFKFLDTVIMSLLEDMIPPTPIRIKERAAMRGKGLKLDQATRLALKLLPSTGQFLKGSADAIFPSELGE